MDSNWVTPLDMLAASGVIDFDAPAFLLDQKPRYIGNPNIECLPLETPMYLPDNIKLRDVPQTDMVQISNDKNLVRNPKWKKILFGGLLAILCGFGLTKLAAKFIKKP